MKYIVEKGRREQTPSLNRRTNKTDEGVRRFWEERISAKRDKEEEEVIKGQTGEWNERENTSYSY